CRFPGCDQPADHCDIDHTIAYPTGPTQASNLKCLCRKHHLLKTFWGWHDQQSPEGTVRWRSPRGQRYTTHPGSRIPFPSLCRPTASVCVPTNGAAAQPNRGLMMPRRTQTRAQSRREYIEQQRRLNDD
ncbi:HNH endonuclease signature motif containing protein, partial [Mycobacterium sp. 2YAF39]|uniref:HNH endonuclease signature motif containing protein n=1 Tax=Mycobacterium sp. 2YAF39 TaxID=3233033 RepID=UPI003F978EA5